MQSKLNFFYGTSQNKDVTLAVREATSSFKTPSLIIFFAPVEIFEKVASLIAEFFPLSQSMGTTACFTYNPEGCFYNSVSVFALNGLNCSLNVIEEINRFPMKYESRVKTAYNNLCSVDNTLCLSFTTAFSLSEELALETLNSVCTPLNIQIIGGTAATTQENILNGRTNTYVSLNGKVYENSCVFGFLNFGNRKFHIYKENIFKPTEMFLNVTSVDVQHRIVHTFNNRPAAAVLAETIGCSVEELTTKTEEYKIGRIAGNEIYISSIDKILDDKSISFHSRIYNNIKVAILKTGNYRNINEAVFNQITEDIPNPSFAFMVQCHDRTIFYKNQNYLEEFSQLAAKKLVKLAGFTSYGEQIGNLHVNDTMLCMVVE